MFKDKTVFVVGAGGSVDAGFPTGDGLKDRITDVLSTVWAHKNTSDRLGEIVQRAINMKCGNHSDTMRNSYFKAVRDICDAMVSSDSIDTFLDSQKSNTFVQEVGKSVIALVISDYERSSILNKLDEYNEVVSQNLDKSWVSEFCKMAWRGADDSNWHTIFDNVSVITFNYDRVIEQHLFHSLKRYFRQLTDIQIVQLIRKLGVIHVYGSLGDIFREQENTVWHSYGYMVGMDNFFDAGKQIHVYTEKDIQPDLLSVIKDKIENASKVVYLGFGFAEQNVEILQASRDRPRIAFCSACKEPEFKREMFKRDIFQMLPGCRNGYLHIASETALDFLRIYRSGIER